MIFRACERMGVLPPGAAPQWDDCTPWAQAQLLAYESLRETEE
jgi:hypothetical protein